MSTDDVSDFELLDAWRAGDTKAGSLLVEREFSSVYRFIRRRIGDADVVQELAQQTLLGCLEVGVNSRSPRFRPFALGVARNIVLRYLRKTATRRDDGEVGLRVIPLMGASPSSIAGARQEQRILVAALRRIPTPLQLVVELFYWEELTTREISGVLGVPQGTVKWRLSEARDALKDEIESASSTSLAEATIRGLDSWARSIRGMVDEALAEG